MLHVHTVNTVNEARLSRDPQNSQGGFARTQANRVERESLRVQKMAIIFTISFAMKLHPTLRMSVAALCLVGTLAGCQTASEKRFRKADVSGDGKLSLIEVNDQLVTEIFATRDANKDSVMTMEEWVVPGDDAGVKSFKLRDADQDGVVSLAEAKAYAQKHGMAKSVVKEADTNKDGFVSLEEARAAYGSKEGLPN